jgi:peptide/nickel transport system substrate-binding protein
LQTEEGPTDARLTGRGSLSPSISAIGVAVLTALALLASPASARVSGVSKPGGTLRWDFVERFRVLDPNLNTTGQHSSQLYLMGNRDVSGPEGAMPVPEAAAGYPRVSRDGRTYTFTVKRGLRFSDGTPVTAANFAYSLNRVLNPTLQSSGAYYITDIVGARDVMDGKAQTASGITVPDRYTLVIKLTRRAPEFPGRLSLSLFPAVSLRLPIVAGGVSDAPFHTAGPYYIKEYEPGQREVLVRNPYWRSDLVPTRTVNPDRLVYTFGISPEESIARVERDESDVAVAVPTSAVRDLARRYGINKGRFFVWPRETTWYVAFNHHRGLFAGNPRLRRAVNYAIDRPALVRTWGFLGAQRTDQLLPPGFPGFVDESLYPLKRPNLAKAKALARGETRNGHAVLYTADFERFRTAAGIFKYDLAQIGITLEVKEFDEAALFDRLARPGEPWDLTDIGFFEDYPDPVDFICSAVSRTSCALQTQGAEFPGWDEKIEAASRLVGEARYRTFARLEADLLRTAAPVAPYASLNGFLFVGKDVGCVVVQVGIPSSPMCKK